VIVGSGEQYPFTVGLVGSTAGGLVGSVTGGLVGSVTGGLLGSVLSPGGQAY
jgi:outer membrane lipoprotein SlyB